MNWYKKLAIAAGTTAVISATYTTGFYAGSRSTAKQYDTRINAVATQIITGTAALQQKSNKVNALAADIARISSLESRLDTISSQFERSAEDGSFDMSAVEDYFNTRSELETARKDFLRKTGKRTYHAESQSF